MTTKTVQHTPGPWTTSRDAVPDWHTQFTGRVCAARSWWPWVRYLLLLRLPGAGLSSSGS